MSELQHVRTTKYSGGSRYLYGLGIRGFDHSRNREWGNFTDNKGFNIKIRLKYDGSMFLSRNFSGTLHCEGNLCNKSQLM